MLHRGDDVAGSVLLIHRDRSGGQRALTRAGGAAATAWRTGATGDSVDVWAMKQRSYDPDLWVIELDTPDLARFIDETID